MSRALRDYIEAQSGQARLDVKSAGDRREQARRALDAGTFSQIVLGYWLAEIRAVEGKQAFLDTAAELRMGKRSAYYAIEHFELFNRFDDIEAVRALAGVEPSKLLALKFTPDELQSLATGAEVHGLTVERLPEISHRDLQQREHDRLLADETLLSLQKKTKQQQHELEARNAELDVLKERLAQPAKPNDAPTWFKPARVEAVAFTEGMRLHLEELERMAATFSSSEGTAESKLYARLLAGTIYHGLGELHARTNALLKDLARHHKNIAGTDGVWEFALDGEQIKTLAARRAEITRAIESGRAERQMAQQQAQPRGRGRPKGSTNKTKKAGK